MQMVYCIVYSCIGYMITTKFCIPKLNQNIYIQNVHILRQNIFGIAHTSKHFNKITVSGLSKEYKKP